MPNLRGLIGAIARKRPSRDVGSVWFVRNGALLIPDKKTKAHPAIILRTGPYIVAPGSSTHDDWPIDARVMEFGNADLAVLGSGFSSPTRFEVSRHLVVPKDDDFVGFIGNLRKEAHQRIIQRLAAAW